MSYIIPVWFVFPVQPIPAENVENCSEIINQTSQQLSSFSASVEKEKWEKYLEIYRTYLMKKSKKNSKKLWTKQEDALLIQYKSRGQSWKQISQNINNTNPKICQRRFQRINQSLIKWPEELDERIKQLVKHQNISWSQIHQNLYGSGENNFPSHTVKELKQRYLLNLRPGIVVEQWQLQEDIALINAIRQRGTHWRKLTQFFQGRTQLQLKNRFYGTLKPLEKKVLRKLNNRMKEFKRTNNISQ